MRWLALESNPEVLSKYIHALGVSEDWSLVDVYGLEDEMLNFIPQPCAAMLLLFPVKELVNEEMGGDGDSQNVFYMKQTIRNACGTIGILHSLANNTHQIDVKPDSPLDKFLTASKGKNANEVAKILEESEDIHVVHDKFAQQGQTATPALEDDVDLHFVSIVLADGHVYELDGRKNGPVKKDASSSEDFLKNAAKVTQEYINAMPNQSSFVLMALVKKPLE